MELMDLSPELREKAAACTSPEELLALAKKEGYKLSEAELEAISGGSSRGSALHCDSLAGDVRKGVVRSQVGADYAEGRIDASDLD